MSEDPDDPQDAPALVALTELGRDAAGPHTSAALDQGLRAVRARMGLDAAQRRVRRRWALVGATAAVALIVAVQMASVGRERGGAAGSPVLVSRIEGGTLLEHGYLSPSGPSGVTVRFSEGSTFALTPGARGRLRSVAADGAYLAVEHGTASLEVTPVRAHRWSVEAGPFLVTVTGTAFTVAWDAARERFELRLRHGRVVVSGPLMDGGIPLRGGQRLVVSLPKAETVITELQPGETAGGPADAAPVASPPSAGGSANGNGVASRRSAAATPPSSSFAKAAPARRWAADLAGGRWDRILADVDRDGVDATLETASSEDLFALADAARYLRRGDLARAALLAQRRRFPSSRRAPDAIFLLGRAEEQREHGTAAQAIARYDEYLTRAPTGAYAAEALGRKMMLTSEVNGAAAAGAIAREYLLRFPAGSYAGAARALQPVP